VNTDMLTDDKAQDATTRERQEGVAEILAMGLLRWRTRNKGFWPSVVAAGERPVPPEIRTCGAPQTLIGPATSEDRIRPVFHGFHQGCHKSSGPSCRLAEVVLEQPAKPLAAKDRPFFEWRAIGLPDAVFADAP
jgi:hypothetical protein